MSDSKIDRLKDVWQKIVTYSEIEKIHSLYADSVVYSDPVVDLSNRDKLVKYWQILHSKYHYIEFKYKSSFSNGNHYLVRWTMEGDSKTLNPGKRIFVDGVSDITFDDKLYCENKNCVRGKIIKQIDYMDMGAAVYKYIPVSMPVGAFVKAFHAKVNAELDD